MNQQFADIILPFPVKGRFTYRIPDNLSGKIKPGSRVMVQFGQRTISSGIVASLHNNMPDSGKIREIRDIASVITSINESQLKLWQWISEYYMCYEGDVLKAALPSDKLINEYRPRLESYIRLAREFTEAELNEALDNLRRAPKQHRFLADLIRLSDYHDGSVSMPVARSSITGEGNSPASVIDALVNKGLVEQISIPVSRLPGPQLKTEVPNDLSEAQADAWISVKNHFKEKDIVLLHGVTSSGKTEIYIHLIQEQLKAGKQVLYMLPEIALTTQIIARLKKHFGSQTGVYHSRFNDREKLEIWQKVADTDPKSGYRLILGVRSSVFLPYNNLGLVIIDEEHDPSYKQQDPAPRYNGRDTAIMLARIHNASTILGSASPSIESYYNAINGKYGLTELNQRFGDVRLPEIVIANTREAHRRKLMVSHFTPELLYSIENALSNNEQVILFQNRRGFSPYIECGECGWIPSCVQCAVNLTYHKGMNRLICHYCGYTAPLPHHCGNCNSTGLITRGFGTEKIEDEIKLVFPAARVARMDQDTTRIKNSFDKIIKSFEQKTIDILIGTQMISKGLDFENLTIVGILNADSMLNFPDFRAHERSFQLMQQVSGRAGRRQKQGKVIIQTGDPVHKIIRFVVRHDYLGMYNGQVDERKLFNYPPYCRMIKINIKHKDRVQLNHVADQLGSELRNVFGKRVLGPEAPVIYRVQLWYIKTIIIKLDREKSSSRQKQIITGIIEKIEKGKGASSLRVVVDVDPY
jgi:primosomal protein N' (replication factor Y)